MTKFPNTFDIQVVLRVSLNPSDFFEDKITVKELLGYFVPRSSINGKNDSRDYEIRIEDKSSRPIMLKEAAAEPTKWDLHKDLSELPSHIKFMNPFPVVTDASSLRSLILDSNHTLAMLINLNRITGKHELVILRHLVDDGSAVVPDFEIINR